MFRVFFCFWYLACFYCVLNILICKAELNLSRNEISGLTGAILTTWPAMKKLDLGDNKLKAVPQQLGRVFFFFSTLLLSFIINFFHKWKGNVIGRFFLGGGIQINLILQVLP